MEKQVVIDQVEIRCETGHVQVRRAQYIIDDDGKRIAGPEYHRVAYEPGDAAMLKEAPIVQKIAGQVWTPDVVRQHRERVAAAAPAAGG